MLFIPNFTQFYSRWQQNVFTIAALKWQTVLFSMCQGLKKTKNHATEHHFSVSMQHRSFSKEFVLFWETRRCVIDFSFNDAHTCILVALRRSPLYYEMASRTHIDLIIIYLLLLCAYAFNSSVWHEVCGNSMFKGTFFDILFKQESKWATISCPLNVKFLSIYFIVDKKINFIHRKLKKKEFHCQSYVPMHTHQLNNCMRFNNCVVCFHF